MTSTSEQNRLTRRKFLGYVGLGIGAATLSGCGIFGQGSTTATRTLPTFPHATSTGQTRSYTFEAAPMQLNLGGKNISTWGFNGGLPGPEVRINAGDTLKVTVQNRLPATEGVTVHWHGVPLVNDMDGVPDVTQKAIALGSDFVYSFVAPTSGTFFYHSHVGLELDRGLYGPLIIESPGEAKNYDYDYVLVLDDWLDGINGTPDDEMKKLIAGGDRMSGTGSMGNGKSMSGMGSSGNSTPAQYPPDIVYPLYLINGHTSDQPQQLTMAKGQRARIRLINASGTTIYHVALQGHRMTVTHTDGQAVKPVEVDAIRIGMGERYDVLVTANNPGVWQLAALAEGTNQIARAVLRYQGSNAGLPPATYQPSELMGQYLSYTMLKAALGTFTPPNMTPDTTIPINMTGGNGQYVWKINNQVYPNAQPIDIQQMKLVRFQFVNTTMMPHPMHLHGHFFQVDNGHGSGPMKDTVIVDPMQKVTVNWISDNPGAWAFHCHNVYHQVAGMMRVVKVG